MAMRDLIPWRRQETSAPTLFREEERSPLVQFRREMDRLFDDFFRAPLFGGSNLQGAGWPSLEVKESEDQVTITAELPGLSEKDVELTVHDGVLTLRGEKKSEHQDKDRGWSERYYGRFERSIALPDGADEAKCEADFRDGVLSVRMPRSREASRGRTIPIGTSVTRH
ncbi:Hsp20/alpha crystallin family protein [Sphingobium naphthae]|uniref:Hsp20/alpha crystallin family protein n=1 Tax=Sphingobium naphthae TaxID=1886786 RepID=UPI002B0770D4|nr:Hsp20/alpha crystallin family protein [Pseudomonadota bacterium]